MNPAQPDRQQDARSRWWKNGFIWACIVSFGIAAVPTIIFLEGLATGKNIEPRCNTTEPYGILFDAHSETSEHYDAWRVLRGETRAFPPATQCLLYGGKYFRSKPDAPLEVKYQLVAERYYPSITSYLWLFLFMALPFIVLFLFRRSRALIRRPREAR